MQKYRADRAAPQRDGATVWYADWNFGPTLARIDKCRLEDMEGGMRRTVYILGEADTFFSLPAACKLQGARVTGYVTGDGEGNLVFRQTYY